MDSRSRRDAQRTERPGSGTGSTGSTGSGRSEGEGERERIRGRMRMVIGQLEGILRELKEVAKELREVGKARDCAGPQKGRAGPGSGWGQDWDGDRHERYQSWGGLGLGLGWGQPWEFCSFLDASTPSDPGDCPEPPRPPPARLMNGGVPLANGPRGGGGTPDSSSEECFGSAAVPKIPAARPAGTRERVRFSDKVLYHALCCDDDGDAGADVPDDPARKGPREQLPRNPGTIPIRRATRNSSTQTVADKSTQTLLPYVPARQRIPNKN
ncbi:CO059 protein, partial [Hylia prasina]|nr:CO059 protein [Hylia prasina]